MVVTLAPPGETETEDKLRIRAYGTSEAPAIGTGTDDWESLYGLVIV